MNRTMLHFRGQDIDPLTLTLVLLDTRLLGYDTVAASQGLSTLGDPSTLYLLRDNGTQPTEGDAVQWVVALQLHYLPELIIGRGTAEEPVARAMFDKMQQAMTDRAPAPECESWTDALAPAPLAAAGALGLLGAPSPQNVPTGQPEAANDAGAVPGVLAPGSDGLPPLVLPAYLTARLPAVRVEAEAQLGSVLGVRCAVFALYVPEGFNPAGCSCKWGVAMVTETGNTGRGPDQAIRIVHKCSRGAALELLAGYAEQATAAAKTLTA